MVILLVLGCRPEPCAESAWFADVDQDGFGSGEPLVSCEAPLGAVAVDGDCDDADATVHPNGVETCLTVFDDDCDGSVEDAVDASTWYEDADADGWGSTAFQACAMPIGATDVGGDCDDTDDAVNPAAIETCKTAWDVCWAA